MAVTAAKSGIGSLFKKGSTAYVEVMEIDPPETELEMLDATHLSSPNNAREKIPGIVHCKPFSVTVNWQPKDTTQADFLTDLHARTDTTTYTIVFEQGTTDTTWSFADCYCTSVKPEKLTVGDVSRAVITFTPSGKVTQA